MATGKPTARTLTGHSNPVAGVAGAVLLPAVSASLGGGPLVTLGLPLALATMASGAARAAGQGALFVAAAALAAPLIANLLGGVTGNAGAASGAFA